MEYVHGINMMPFTPITAELLPADYMREEWPVLATALTRYGVKCTSVRFQELLLLEVLPFNQCSSYIIPAEVGVFCRDHRDAGCIPASFLKNPLVLLWIMAAGRRKVESHSVTTRLRCLKRKRA